MRGRLKQIVRRLRGGAGSSDQGIVSLQPQGVVQGQALLSYILDPFVDGHISNDHTHFWESWHIAQALLDRGIAVDVISYQDRKRKLDKSYTHFISARTNFERLADQLSRDCKKIVHLDTAHWLFNNTAAYQRLLDLQNRRGVTLHNLKMVEPNWSLESADMGTVLGNEFTMETYRYANKPLHRIPISAPTVYDWDETKSFAECRQNFMWFGSSGFVHKGLDLVIEAFARMPDKQLYVCGPLEAEKEFVEAYRDELYQLDNIHAVGWVDVDGQEFRDLNRRCVGLVYPSCSEGGGGSAITCMHGGMIPIVSRETSVDVGPGGEVLKRNSIEEICNRVRALDDLTEAELQERARACWETARANHTRDSFACHFNNFVDRHLI